MGKLTLKSVRARKKEKEILNNEFRPIKLQLKDVFKFMSKYDTWVRFKPLKLGIVDDLYPLVLSEVKDVSKRAVRSALYAHARDKKYLSNIVSGNSRYSITGERSGDITSEQKEYSVCLLEEMKNEK